MRLPAAVAALALGASAPAAVPAAPLTTEVAEVTVYPNGQARVVRAGAAELAAGPGELVVEGLPAAVVADSVQVTADADGVRVGSVEVASEPVSAPPRERERELRARLADLEAGKAAVTDRLETARTQLTFVEGLAELPRREGAGSALTGAEAAERWPQLWQRIGEGARQARRVIREAARERAAIADEIAAVEKALDQLGQGRKTRTRLRIGLSAEAATRAAVSVAYRVRGVQWQPIYEAHLATDDGRLELVRKARVRQRTGTDWTDVRLALATVPPVAGDLPELDTWWVDFARPRPVREKAGTTAQRAPAPASDEAKAPSWTAHGEFTPVYRVAGTVSVPGANQPRTVVLGRRTVAAELAVRAVPQKGERAWLTAEAEWTGEGALPPGPVRRYRDGAFVGAGRWAAWSPGEARHLAFGLDPRFEVAMRPLTDQAAEEGLIRKRQVRTRHYRIALTNRHDRAVAGSVRFRVPVPRNEAIEVAPWFPAAPDREAVDGKQGVHAWERTFPPGETVVIRAGYRVSMPEGKAVPGF